MTEGGFTSSSTALDSGDQYEGPIFGIPFHGRPSFQSLDSVDETDSANDHIASQPRSSSDSRSKSPTSQPWRDTASSLSDRREPLSTIHNGTPTLVEPSFDEHVLRALCELDVNFFVVYILHSFF